MSAPDTPLPLDTPLFDVYASLPTNTSVDAIDPLTLGNAGLSPDRVEALLQAFRNGPRAKIGASVTQERSEKAKALFAKTGLVISVEPLLGLAAAAPTMDDGLVACPACDRRVALPDNRQCPACGVFVDKVDEAFLLKRKIMQQERAKIEFSVARETSEADKKSRQSLEAALRAKIRDELEAEYGLQRGGSDLFQGKAGLLRAAGLLGLMALAFAGGQNLPSVELPWGKKTTSAASVDKMLQNSLGTSGVGSPASVASEAVLASVASDDIANDPMMQAIGGHRVGAKGLSIEQALSAISVITKSAPLHTANVNANGAPVSASATDTLGNADVAPSAVSATAAVTVPPAIKLAMQTEFAVTLASLGQSGRARGVLQAITTPVSHKKQNSLSQIFRLLLPLV